MRDAQPVSARDVLRAGARIANAQGIPGTLGCCGRTLDDQRLVFLSTHHVLFGAHAHEQEYVSADCGPGSGLLRIARTRHGRCGTVRLTGIDVHVDCATAEVVEQLVDLSGVQFEAEPVDTSPLTAGTRVVKTGATTGTTEGIVVDGHANEEVRIAGRRIHARGTIVVRAPADGERFSADGDSGAVLRGPSGAIVGLVWGVNARGDTLACPIAPVLRVLHVCLARVELTGA